jgi:hypothetical protein
MSLYQRFAGSQFGSSLIFGTSFFAATFAADGAVEAATTGSLAALSWFTAQPLLKHLIGAAARA